ncbi:hypothetical protein SAMN05216388_105011 [Halorientalis persicus]|uniref:Uncharacterized protein n=1 Tax=Halorientalis persicus TaxID=1367881 RepID=A0A1H8W7I0_9EURY|nr:hypothetical protein [Halorientalis persicus]SEP23377.1 hypothetical protein SAMN05216388_105011 [Halorientalis persicus]
MAKYKDWDKTAETRSHITYTHKEESAIAVAYLFADTWNYGILVNGYPAVLNHDHSRKANAQQALAEQIRNLSTPRCKCFACGAGMVPIDVNQDRNEWMKVTINARCSKCFTALPTVTVPRFLDWTPANGDVPTPSQKPSPSRLTDNESDT